MFDKITQEPTAIEYLGSLVITYQAKISDSFK